MLLQLVLLGLYLVVPCFASGYLAVFVYSHPFVWDVPGAVILLAVAPIMAIHAFATALRTMLAWMSEPKPTRRIKRYWVQKYTPPCSEDIARNGAWARRGNLFSDAELNELQGAFTKALEERFARSR